MFSLAKAQLVPVLLLPLLVKNTNNDENMKKCELIGRFQIDVNFFLFSYPNNFF